MNKIILILTIVAAISLFFYMSIGPELVSNLAGEINSDLSVMCEKPRIGKPNGPCIGYPEINNYSKSKYNIS